MTEIGLTDYAGLEASEHAEIAKAIGGHHGLDDIFA